MRHLLDQPLQRLLSLTMSLTRVYAPWRITGKISGGGGGEDSPPPIFRPNLGLQSPEITPFAYLNADTTVIIPSGQKTASKKSEANK